MVSVRDVNNLVDPWQRALAASELSSRRALCFDLNLFVIALKSKIFFSYTFSTLKFCFTVTVREKITFIICVRKIGDTDALRLMRY